MYNSNQAPIHMWYSQLLSTHTHNINVVTITSTLVIYAKQVIHTHNALTGTHIVQHT